jgi:hypothetical protein
MIEFCIIRRLPTDMPACPQCGQRETGLVSRKLADSPIRWLIMCLNPACTFTAPESLCQSAALIAWYVEALRALS